jgi:carboxypeptidase Q
LLLALTSICLQPWTVDCIEIPDSVREQIRSKQEDVNRIIDYIVNGDGKHETFNRLAHFGDLFGTRQTGSDALEKSIDYVLESLRNESFTNVHGENVTVPKWIRGNESAALVAPRYQNMPILSLGGSVGTGDMPGGCLEADVYVVRSFQELEEATNSRPNISGKIVVYNVPWQGSYSETVVYRSLGAVNASQKGAVAALVRSVTEFSIASPHTGQQTNSSIPGACITIEDAEMLDRMFTTGMNPRVRICLDARNEEPTVSRNVVAELRGSEFPDSTVIFGGHIDTWDVGSGSMDDGGGVMIAWQAMSILKALNLTPRRTIRLVLWTAEEQGLIGGEQYYQDHKNEADNVSVIIESDAGVFKPRGIGFTGTQSAEAVMSEILTTLLSEFNLTSIKSNAGASSDTHDWVDNDVPGIELYSYNEDYFHFHHTHGDTMTVLNADDLDMATLLWATIVYTVGCLDDNLPRTEYEINGAPPALSAASTLLIAAVLSAYYMRRS